VLALCEFCNGTRAGVAWLPMTKVNNLAMVKPSLRLRASLDASARKAGRKRPCVVNKPKRNNDAKIPH